MATCSGRSWNAASNCAVLPLHTALGARRRSLRLTPLLDTILDDVQRMIAGKFQQDDLTLLTARVSLAGR